MRLTAARQTHLLALTGIPRAEEIDHPDAVLGEHQLELVHDHIRHPARSLRIIAPWRLFPGRWVGSRIFGSGRVGYSGCVGSGRQVGRGSVLELVGSVRRHVCNG